MDIANATPRLDPRDPDDLAVKLGFATSLCVAHQQIDAGYTDSKFKSAILHHLAAAASQMHNLERKPKPQ